MVRRSCRLIFQGYNRGCTDPRGVPTLPTNTNINPGPSGRRTNYTYFFRTFPQRRRGEGVNPLSANVGKKVDNLLCIRTSAKVREGDPKLASMTIKSRCFFYTFPDLGPLTLRAKTIKSCNVKMKYRSTAR